MKKQKRRGLALLLAFVMLVGLLYVPGSSLNAYAENTEPVKDPVVTAEVVEQVKVVEEVKVEEESPPAELPVITEEDEQTYEVAPDDLDAVEVQNGEGVVGIMSNDELGLSPNGGNFYNGEVVNISVLNAHDWHYSYQINGGQWKWALKAAKITVNNDATVKVADLRVREKRQFPFFEFYTVMITGAYNFEAPAMPTGLGLESRTLHEITVKWDPSQDTNIDHYNVYIKEDGVWGPAQVATGTSYTFSGLDREESLVVGVTAVYNGHVTPAAKFESAKADGTFKTAAYQVVTEVRPAKGGTITPEIQYLDKNKDSEYATAVANIQLAEGYQVNSWQTFAYPQNPIADVFGLGELDSVEAEATGGWIRDKNDLPPVGTSYSGDVDRDTLIVAKTALKVFTVEVAVDPSNTGTASVSILDGTGKELKNPNRYQYGTKLVLTATPNPGYLLDCWVDQEGNTVTSPYTVTGAATLTAKFIKEPVGIDQDKLVLVDFFAKGGNKVVTFTQELFEDKSLSSEGDVEAFGAAADRRMVSEIEQTVPYKTALKDLLYHVKLKPLLNSEVEIKDGTTFGDLSNEGVAGQHITFDVYNDTDHTMIKCSNQDLEGMIVQDGRYVIKLKVHNKYDKRFADRVEGEQKYDYTNEVVVYTLGITMKVQKPAVELTVDAGGQVSKTVERPEYELAGVETMVQEWPLMGEVTKMFHWNEGTVQVLTAEPQNPDAYQFVEWKYRVRGTEEWSTSDSNVLRLTMNNNYEAHAVFAQVKYSIVQSAEITDQGVIKYKIVEKDTRPSASELDSDNGWTPLPTTIDLHYGDRVLLKAEPSMAWLFKRWITPNHGSHETSVPAIEMLFMKGAIAGFDLDGRMVDQFPDRVMTANVEFMSNYGFSEYDVTGSEIQNFKGLKQDPRVTGVEAKIPKVGRGDMSFDYHVPFGTTLEEAMEMAKFNTIFETFNETNEVQLLGRFERDEPQAGSVVTRGDDDYIIVSESPDVVQIEMIDGVRFNPFFSNMKYKDQTSVNMPIFDRENSFEYRYRVLQYPSVGVTSAQSYDRPLYKEYTVRVNVVVDEPLLTVEVPVGGTVTRQISNYLEPVPGETTGPTALVLDAPVVDVLSTGFHYKNYRHNTPVSLVATPAAGYTFDGWTTAEGYTVPVEDIVLMDDNYKVKPIFTAIQKRNRRNNNNTPQEEIAQILDETTPLGILYRQLFIGYPNGDLRMFDSINRAQLSLILQRAQQYDVTNPPQIPVSDVMEDWYKKEALAALGKGYMSLRPGNIFGGYDAVTGAELVQALNKAFGANLTLEQAYQLANGVSSEQVGKIMTASATDFQLAMSGMVPLGAGGFDANKPVPRETVARMIYAVLYPQPAVEATAPATPQ